MREPAGFSPPDPALHERISDIIRRHSSNRVDIRRAAFDGIDLARAHRFLDLGCGFGFAARALHGRTAPGAMVLGIDCQPENRVPFLASATAAGCRGSFLCHTLQSKLDFPAGTFDVVIASYSLYFFPGVIPEVARVLQPGGRFVVITHSEADFATLLWAVGVPPERSALRALIRAFSAENGAARLRDHFTAVEQRPYPNTLVFAAKDLDEFLALVRYKSPQLALAAGGPPPEPAEVERRSRDLLSHGGTISIEKDDAIFICTGPQT